MSSDNDDIVSSINITPLVDVVLVLLVIFMVTAPAMYQQHNQSGLKVQIPKAQSGEAMEQPTAINLTLTKEGSLSLDNQTISLEALPQALQKYGDPIIEKTAVISADEQTPHGMVIRLMDTLKQAGLTKFAMTVDAHVKN